MCGIAGVLNLNGEPVEREILVAMTRAIAHRGPDDDGIFITRNVGLGHRRLSILDLSSAGHQPMLNSSGRLCLSYNGEIYNAGEIRQQTFSHHHFRGHSDTEVLLYAYEEWGANCLSRLNGMFAFAIWDNHTQELFLARDRFGVKPLFYFCDGKRFAFASEIKALLSCPFIPRDPDMNTAVSYLVDGVQDGPSNTYFAKIRQLPPSHAMVVSAGAGLRTWQYYAIRGSSPGRPPCPRDAAERVRDLLFDAVKLRLISDVPVVTSLSGGFDSTAIVTYAVRTLQGVDGGLPHKTFTACFRGASEDERPFVELVANELPLERHYVFIEPASFLDQLETQTRRQDQPVMSAAMIAKGEVMRAIHEAGFKVVLEGQGVDEYGCGYTDASRYAIADLFKRGDIVGAARQMNAWKRIAGVTFWDALLKSSELAFPSAVAIVRQAKGRVLFRAGLHGNRDFLDARLREVTGVDAPPRYSEGILDNYCIRQMFARNLPFFLRCDDHNAMAFSVEGRQPFLDYRLVEYVLSLPGNYRIRQGWSKWIFREAMKGVIPEAIRSYPGKRPFPTPQVDWLTGPARREIEARLGSLEFQKSSFFDSAAVCALYKDLANGDRGLNFIIWRILNYDAWLRCFVL